MTRRRAIQRLGCGALEIGALAAASSCMSTKESSQTEISEAGLQGTLSSIMTGKKVMFGRELPVRHEIDVFVAGGGPAGIAAAIAAARQGATTFLAEGEVCFGGMGTSGGLPLFCSFTDGVNFVAGGVGKMVHERLHKAKAVSISPLRGNRDVYFNPEPLKRIYDDMVTDAGVKFAFGTHVIAAECVDGWVRHVVCYGKSGLYAVVAKVYVDATGDGDICAWAGAPFEKGDQQGRMQPGTFVSMWAGIDWEAAEAANCGVWNQSGFLRQAIRDKVFSVPDPDMPGIIPTGRTTGNGNTGHLFGVDGTDERSITRAAIQGRKMAPEYEVYFERYLKGYERMQLVSLAARVGIRETRRIVGDYVLNVDDFRKRAIFDDEIGRFAYAIDVHAETLNESNNDAGHSFEDSWLPDGESYGIPYRVLTPKSLKNVLAAGRCVSVDRKVHGSIRVMPGCFITGQAAGVAAAMAAKQDTDSRSISVKDLQGRLIALGAYLPNAYK